MVSCSEAQDNHLVYKIVPCYWSFRGSSRRVTVWQSYRLGIFIHLERR